MGAIKFETFELQRDSDSESASISREKELAQVRDEAYASGFKDGVNVTNEALEAGQSEIAKAIQETLNDVAFSQSAALQLSMSHIGATIEAFCAAIAPNIAKAGLGAELSEILDNALRHHSEIRLSVHHALPDQDIVRAIVETKDQTIALHADPDLPKGRVRLTWADGFDQVDMDEAVAKALLSITNFTNLLDKDISDGRSDILAG